MKRGRWRVGNGESIDIYENQWILREKTFRLLSLPRPGLKVSSQIVKTGNINVLTNLLVQDDVDEIQDIPIVGVNHPP